MRSDLVVAALLPALAAAKPIESRGLYIETKIVTVFVPGPSPAPPLEPQDDLDDGAALKKGFVDSAKVAQQYPPTLDVKLYDNVEGAGDYGDETPPVDMPQSDEGQFGTPESDSPSQSNDPNVPPQSDSLPSGQGDGQLILDSSMPVDAAPFSQKIVNYLLEAHNIHRANHSAEPLTWSTDMEQAAMADANSCVYEHVQTKPFIDGRYGQNMAWWTPNVDLPIDQYLHDFYNYEIERHTDQFVGDSLPADYGLADHFTQLVWKGTKEVGCSLKKCASLSTPEEYQSVQPDAWLFYCNYWPAGNSMGEFENVAIPQGAPIVRLNAIEGFNVNLSPPAEMYD